MASAPGKNPAIPGEEIWDKWLIVVSSSLRFSKIDVHAPIFKGQMIMLSASYSQLYTGYAPVINEYMCDDHHDYSH